MAETLFAHIQASDELVAHYEEKFNGDYPALWQDEEDEGIGAAGVAALSSVDTVLVSPDALREADELKAAIRWNGERNVHFAAALRTHAKKGNEHAARLLAVLEGK